MFILLGALVGLVLLYLALRIVSMLWRGTEQILNEVVSGVRLFFVLAWRTLRALHTARRWLKRVGLCAARHAHAALFTWGYVLKRRYVASELRRMRRERHA